MFRALLALCLLFFSTGSSFANGGAPLLLVVGSFAFVYGSVGIVLIEAVAYNYLAGRGSWASIGDAFYINLLSTLVIGLGFPICIAAIGYAGAALPEPFGSFSAALGTWVYSGVARLELTYGFTIFWLLTTFALTIWFEQRILASEWQKNGFEPRISVFKLICIANSISYSMLACIALFLFY